MLVVVIDTCVIASALRSRRGASFRVVDMVADRLIVPVATTALFLEYEDVLNRSEQRAVHGLAPADIAAFLDGFAARCRPVEVEFRWRPQLSDPNDEMVLEAAINGRATAIITHNLRDFRAAAQFGIEPLRPRDLIERMAL
jgi:putative PIN family toxin of toxin-antitoxin system